MTRAVCCFALVALATAVPVFSQSDGTGTAQARIEELEQRIAKLEERLRRIEAEPSTAVEAPASEVAEEDESPDPVPVAAAPPHEAPRQVTAPAPPMAEVIPTKATSSVALDSAATRMPVSGYMDYHFNKPGGLPGTGDFHRFVLLFGHRFNDRIQFWSELELEHAFVSGEGGFGELELEQAYLDFLVKPWLNVRSGIMLTPVGLINERHEPPSFNGVERTFVDTVIIPSTWFGPGVGIHGDLGAGFVYKAYMMDPLDSSLFSAGEGFREGRQKAFKAVMQNPAFTGRLEYHGLPGASLGASFWSGKTGFATPGINPRLKIFEFDGRGAFGRFDFRGQFAQTTMNETARLNALLQRTSGISPNLAERMRGYYLEGAYHLLPYKSRHDLVAFSRYENFDTQNRMAPGFLPLNEFDRDALVTGFTYFPEPDVALKFDYTILRNQSRFIKSRNGLNLGIGWWF